MSEVMTRGIAAGRTDSAIEWVRYILPSQRNCVRNCRAFLRLSWRKVLGCDIRRCMYLGLAAFMVAHAEKGAPLLPVLKAEGLTLAGFARLQRAWTKRLVADEALSSTFRGWVEQVKKQL